MPGELERLAFDLSLRALSQQEHVVDELRSRTGTLLAVSSVAASFLGARALDRGIGLIAVCALVAFLVSVTSSLYILFPNRKLRFTLTGGVVLRDKEVPRDVSETHAWLSRGLDLAFTRNERAIGQFLLTYQIAAGSVAVSIILWSVDLAV